MAPSRRKGANRAAAAAAALRKFKVGDLVLAKVKGFPAWPATVSNPEKWGYRPDWKKVVVAFFGTEQIAFCNPADVEEFTEEKKISLLGKRHGKGADFVRAVNEIIDSFEKLKKQNQINRANGTEETNITNNGNSEEFLSKSLKDEAPVATVKPLSTGTANDLNALTEAAVAAAAKDALHDEAMQVEAPSNLVFTETPVSPTNLTRRKTDVARLRNNCLQRRKPARRLRSSSRKDASRVQSIMLPSTNKTRSTRRSRANALQDRSLRRSKRIMKSSDDSEGQDADSLAFVSNDSIEESDSGVMTMDSDTRSINDDSTIDSGTKPVGAEPPENNEGETEVSDRLDFQSNTIVIKKKRKPNRKRHNSDTVEAAKQDVVASDAEVLRNDCKRYKSDSVEASKLDVVASDAEVLKNDCVSPSFSENLAQRYAKDDGDEHLPLVKRARVRMGRPSPAAEEKVTLVHKEEKMFEVPETLAMQSSESLSCKVGSPCGKESVCIEKDQSHMSPAKKPHVWEIKKNFVDEEATLPPSKRLHRALEAMSANVADDCQGASNPSPATNIRSNGYCPSVLECSELSMENKAVTELESGAVEGLSNGDFLLGASEFCTVSNVEMAENDAKTMVVASDCGRAHSNDNTSPELCKGSSEHEEGTDSKGPKGSTINEAPAEIDECTESKSPKRSTISEVPAEIDAKHHVGELALNCNIPSPIVCPTDHCKAELSDLHGAAKGSDPDIFQMASVVGETGGGCSNMGNMCVRRDAVDGEGDKIHKMKHLQSAEKNKDSKRSEFVDEPQPASLDSNILVSVTTVKDSDSGDRRSLLHSTSTSYDHTDDRTVSVTQSSSSLTDGPESVARASPPSSSVCNVSASDNYSIENNSSCSPDVQIHLEKAKLASKSGSKGESLSSFEAIIRSLTRTKESIGRATRIAIDCAKSGFATKVVEILARNLESESSLHKKVDLFFLVDSITQCSRGMKGDGGIYPSAIQALLPRLLLAAAPPGCSSHENHRQCLKVLRVWQERNILPEPIIRHHIRELDALCGTYPSVGSRRPLRNERAFDDPIREMEGMQVDEYGSNSSIQLPGFCMPPMLRDDDDGSESDGESFEAVTPEHSVENFDGEKNQVPAIEKRSHILEDVDGELEMEDVAPCCEVEITSTSKIAGADLTQMSHHQSDNHYRTSALSPPPPPPPPPPPHPLPPSGFPPAVLNSVSNGSDSKPYSSSQQNFNSNLHQPVLPRAKTTTMDGVHHRVHHTKDFEAPVPRHMPESSSDCSFGDRPVSRLSSRASNSIQPTDAFSKGFHLRPPYPAPTNQFSYVQEQRIQARRDIPPPSHPNRFHTRNAENGNFYRDRDRNKYVPCDDIGECWRPQYPSISGPCYPDGDRMTHEPTLYGGQPREPPNNRWNCPPRPMNHRHFNPYRPPSEGPIPVANRGPNYWRPR